MKNSILISIITAIIVFLYTSEDIKLKILAIVLALLALIYLFTKQTIIYNYHKSKMESFKEESSKPFININKVSWKVLMLIPNIDKMTAKHIVHNRRHFGKYKNFDDFFKVNQISEDKREEIKKYIIM